MVVTSTCTDVGSMGDRKYAYGTFRQSGVGRTGFILVPMGRIDYIQLQDVPLVSGATCTGVDPSFPYGITFPYSSGVGTNSTQMSRNNIPIKVCFSGSTGQWWAFGKRG
ncbi:unnamed protein product [marine sediment metagenome]|uniref:Uncharacterized protein n=1 Tax=marine sediment metagenome TaxID=412755 RepID=X1BEN0_9ZZZZ